MIPRHRATTPAPARAARGFTIIELIVVVGIIAVIAGILLATFGRVRNASQRGADERFNSTIGQAVQAFERDLRYLPPLLIPRAAALADVVAVGELTPGNNAEVGVPDAMFSTPADLRTALDRARYGSEFSLAAYLMGTGDINNSEATADETLGRNDDEDDGLAGPGIRDPGPDRSWGGAADRVAQRNTPGSAIKTGRTFGPYLDPAQLAGNIKLDTRTGLFKFVDAHGQPVRYYTGWPKRSRTGGQPQPSIDHTPIELRTAAAVEAQIDAGGTPNLDLERGVFNAPFMIVSAGKPQAFEPNGTAIPFFGDRKRDAAELSAALALIDYGANRPFNIGDLSLINECDTAWVPPGELTGETEERQTLLDDLLSNVRFVP
ncbi:MAG: prepilin-type N-terminal cleavage/methylation domain-containing protein [Planctomycetota bacterium]|nr:prepilin-type N-terminal cleavage/methylation domain-containing protein [Planctomycetota bacterium]